MIITGGEARGRRIASPEGLCIRPTGSKIRQALFNILGRRVDGARFLDIFAGSGLMGLEALSRGASQLVAVEDNRKMVRAIESSLSMLGYEGQVLAGDFRQVLRPLQPQSFDIIFADPPYKTTLGSAVVHFVESQDLLAPEGIFVVEHIKGYEFPADLTRLKLASCRTYGQTGLAFFHRIL